MPISNKRKSAAKKTWAKRFRPQRMSPGRMVGRATGTASQVHRFVNQYQYATLQGAAGTATFGNFFQGYNGIVPNLSDITALFDQVRISYVKFAFYVDTAPDAAAVAVAQYPFIWTIRDHTDNSTVATVSAAQEFGTYRVRQLQPGKPYIIGFKPSTLAANQTIRSDGVTFTNTPLPMYGQWLRPEDLGASGAMFTGLKVGVLNHSNTDQRVRCMVTVWYQAKTQR